MKFSHFVPSLKWSIFQLFIIYDYPQFWCPHFNLVNICEYQRCLHTIAGERRVEQCNIASSAIWVSARDRAWNSCRSEIRGVSHPHQVVFYQLQCELCVTRCHQHFFLNAPLELVLVTKLAGRTEVNWVQQISHCSRCFLFGIPGWYLNLPIYQKYFASKGTISIDRTAWNQYVFEENIPCENLHPLTLVPINGMNLSWRHLYIFIWSTCIHCTSD